MDRGDDDDDPRYQQYTTNGKSDNDEQQQQRAPATDQEDHQQCTANGRSHDRDQQRSTNTDQEDGEEEEEEEEEKKETVIEDDDDATAAAPDTATTGNDGEDHHPHDLKTTAWSSGSLFEQQQQQQQQQHLVPPSVASPLHHRRTTTPPLSHTNKTHAAAAAEETTTTPEQLLRHSSSGACSTPPPTENHVATSRSRAAPPAKAFSRIAEIVRVSCAGLRIVGNSGNGNTTNNSNDEGGGGGAGETRTSGSVGAATTTSSNWQPARRLDFTMNGCVDGGDNRRIADEDCNLEEEEDLESALLPVPVPTSSSHGGASSSSVQSQTTTSRIRYRLQRPVYHRDNIIVVRQWIRQFGNYLAYCTLLTMLVLVPSVLYHALKVNKKLDIAAFRSAWVMVCGTIVLSARLVYLHLTHWYMPEVQKYIVRILWMVPIYSIQSYLSLRFHHARVYMATIRDFYEAYVIASFVYYLMELLGGQDALVEILRNKDPSYGRHTIPFSFFLQEWELGTEFMLQCKHGVLQYVLFKTTATVLTFLCEFAGVYGEGTFNWLVAYPYLCFFQNISVMYALYCLVMLFHAVNDELRHPINWHPLGKFLCIKGVVFFTWWQGVLIFYLKDHGIIEQMGSWSSNDVANGLIDYCIVIEMVGFAIAHSYTFTYTEYLPGRLPPPALPSTSSNNMEGQQQAGPQHNHNSSTHSSNNGTYRPPATLPQPMKFKDALWSSTVPHETLQDLQRLRSGLIPGVSAFGSNGDENRVRSFSMQELNNNIDGEDATQEPLLENSKDGLTRAETTDV